MSQPYIGEIRYVGFNFAPQGWALCEGQLMSIAQDEALFQLIGTTYGGDGQQTFALPDLRSRVAIHQGAGFVIGEIGGAETVTLFAQDIPAHGHAISAVAGNGNSPSPTGNYFAASSAGQYAPVPTLTGDLGNVVSPAGGSQPHSNLQPYLTMNCIIALFGIFPSQS